MTDPTLQSSTPSQTHNPEGLNTEISTAFQKTEDIENKALEIEKRIRSIDGVSNNLLPKRKYGTPVNGESFGMTLASIVESKDPELGSYLGISTGYWRRKEEEKVSREMQAESMRLATEKLQAENAQSRKRREWESMTGINSLTGRKFGL